MILLVGSVALVGVMIFSVHEGARPGDPEETGRSVPRNKIPDQAPASAPAPGVPTWDDLPASGFCPSEGPVRLPSVAGLLQAASADPHAPRDLLRAEQAVREGNWETARKRLWSIRRKLADHPQGALAFALLQAQRPRLEPAIEAVDAYLRAHPATTAVRQLKARLQLQADLQKDHLAYSHDGVTVLVTQAFKRTEAEALQEMVLEALDQAADLTGTLRREALTVVVYHDHADLLASSCVRTWAAGLYDGTIRLSAEAWARPSLWRKRVRHEVLHAQLHTRVGKIPRWFNEGLAQYFANQFGQAHVESYGRMLKAKTWIPFSSLEGTFVVFADTADARLAYHQSLALVLMLIDHQGRSVIGDGVTRLKRGQEAGLIEALFGSEPGGQDLLDFLARLRDGGWKPPRCC